MTGRILIVDDMDTNIRVLTAKLEAEYYDVLSALSGHEAVETAIQAQPDLILLDVMMPVMDGFETCRALKRNPITQHIPIIMVTALDQQKDRVDGLQAGADDFLSKPIDDVALFARVRSLLRLNAVMDELRIREASGRAMGAMPELKSLPKDAGGNVLIVEENERFGQRIIEKLGPTYQCQIIIDQMQAQQAASDDRFDLVLINLASTAFDGLRLCARIRAGDATRKLPILCMVDADDKDRSVRALDLGANDILERPVERNELQARVHTLLQRRFYAEQLRENLDQSLEMAFRDQLTGMFNRRHMDVQLEEIARRVTAEIEPAVLMISDIDHFKKVNDTWGHQAGDLILQQIAEQMKESFRAIDIVCRYGGEEFVVLMPGADLASARAAAERYRTQIELYPFKIGEKDDPLHITISAGLSVIAPDEPGAQSIRRADAALYHAKEKGRNCVIAAIKKGSTKQVAI